MNSRNGKIWLSALLVGFIAASPAALASDVDDLTAMLHEFLAGASVGDVSAHDKFWSDDLVYTSSAGTRTDKAEIIASMTPADESAETSDDAAPSTVYSAEDIQVDLYGSTAIVAFKLVGTPQGDSNAAIAYYFNTGTFLKRGGAWQVIAWQATKIPVAEE